MTRHKFGMKNCQVCNTDFMAWDAKHKYCSKKCAKKHVKNRNQRGGIDYIPTGTVGAISELRVAVDLMKNGYHVFRALSPSCPCDLLVFRDGKLIEIEVRTAVVNKSGYYFSKMTKRSAVIFAAVLPDKIIYQEKSGQVIFL